MEKQISQKNRLFPYVILAIVAICLVLIMAELYVNVSAEIQQYQGTGHSQPVIRQVRATDDAHPTSNNPQVSPTSEFSDEPITSP